MNYASCDRPVVMGAYRTSRWGQVHWRRAGSTGPTIVFIHECPLSSRVWERVMARLSTGARVLAFDIPGCGSSTRPPHEGLPLTEYAGVLAEAIEAETSGPITVAGVHSGASLAIEIAGRLDRTSHLAVSGPLILEPEVRASYLANWAPPKSAQPDGQQVVEAVTHYLSIWPGADRDMLELAVVEMLRNREHYHWAYNAAFAHDPAPTVSRLDVPLLAITAENDRLASSDTAAVDLARIGRQVVAAGLNGQPHLRAPDWYASELLRFMST